VNTDIQEQRAKAFDYLFDAVVVTDLKGIITDWNKGSVALYGYSKEEAIGQLVSILHVPEDTDHITEEVISAVAKFGKWTGEVRMLHKDGHIGWIESMCVPIHDSNDQMIGALGVNRDISDRIKETKRLEHLAHYDNLTKIPNRYLVLDRVDHLIAKSERDSSSFAMLFIDLDNFKSINDTRGHVFGDQVLIETAVRLKQSIRNSDTAARIGGDEFLVLLENTSNRDDVSTKVEALAEAIGKNFIIAGEDIEVGYSIGVAIYPDDGTTTDALLNIADKAMYSAKHRKRNKT
jgi:diguanylate cyclase (GGDEF)-like protein/PAS domain S-box-containing protein